MEGYKWNCILLWWKDSETSGAWAIHLGLIVQRLQGNMVYYPESWRASKWKQQHFHVRRRRKRETLLCKTNSERSASKWHNKNIALLVNEVLKMQKAGSAYFLSPQLQFECIWDFSPSTCSSPPSPLPSPLGKEKAQKCTLTGNNSNNQIGINGIAEWGPLWTCKRANVVIWRQQEWWSLWVE